MEFTNILNRAYWSDPTGAAVTNFKLQQTYLSNGNVADGFGKVTTTGVTAFGTTANLLPSKACWSGVSRFKEHQTDPSGLKGAFPSLAKEGNHALQTAGSD
jgi:hypothetical protein